MRSSPRRSQRSGLSRAVASAPVRTAREVSLRLNTASGRRFLAELARFSTGGAPQYSGTSLAYHAAQDTRFRDYTGGYLGLRSRPEEDMLRTFDRAKIVARARLMFRNNPYLSALLSAYVQEIGTPTYKSTARLLRADGTHDGEASKTYNNARESRLHSYFLDCETDRALSLEQVVEILGFEDCIAGELFAVKQRDGSVQLIPSELCGSQNYAAMPIPAVGTFQDGTPLPDGATERDGIVRAPWRPDPKSSQLSTYVPGQIIGYRFAQRDPITSIVWFTPEKSTVVPAQYVWHIYDPDRVEQNRGVPKLAPVLNALLDVYETAHARTQQVKNQASLSMWVTKSMDPYGFAQAMQGQMRTGQFADAAALKEIATQRSSYEEMRAGSVYYGAPGEGVTLIEPKPNAQDFHAHYIDLLQVCSACLNGMPVEVSIEGFRLSSYSSARATMNKWRRNVIRLRRRREQQFLDPLQLWQTNRAELFGDLPNIPQDQKSECYWGWPAIPDIDGTKTALQNAAELAIGATNLRTIYADKGLHHDVEMRQFVHEKGDFLEMFIEEGMARGLTQDQAQAWALTQVPSDAGASKALAALISATGAMSNDDGTAPAKKPAGKSPAATPPSAPSAPSGTE